MLTFPKPKSRTLTIDEDVIARSDRNSTRTCMVATAIREQLGAWSVAVTADTIRFNIGGEKHRGDIKKGIRYTYPTPAKVRVAIQDFDDRKPVKPFKIILQAAQFSMGELSVRKPHQKKKYVKQKRKSCPYVCTKRRFHGVALIEKTK